MLATRLLNRSGRSVGVAMLVLATALLAGCNQVNELAAEAELLYDGAQSGTHSDTTSCDADGSIKGSGDITDGQVAVRVTDGDGTTMFQRTFDGEFSLPKQSLDGDSGDWTLSAARGGDDLLGDEFRGEYAFFLNC